MLSELTDSTFSDLLGRLLLVLLVLVLTWLARRLLQAGIPVLTRVLTRRTPTTLDENLLRATTPPLRMAVSVLGLWIAAALLEFAPDIADNINRLMSALLIIALFWAIYRAVDVGVGLVPRLTRSQTAAPSPMFEQKLTLLVRQLGKALVLILVVLELMDHWHYNAEGLLAGLGIGGLAVALAAQDALANLIGYFAIIADEPFVVGETIKVDDKITGTVEQLGFRSSRIRQVDQSLVSVPNKTMANANITNLSRLTKRRLEFTLGLSYESQPGDVLGVVEGIQAMLRDNPLVEPDSIVVQVAGFGTRSIDVLVACFVRLPDFNQYLAFRHQINFQVLQMMADRNVQTAAPVYDVLLRSTTEMPAAPES